MFRDEKNTKPLSFEDSPVDVRKTVDVYQNKNELILQEVYPSPPRTEYPATTQQQEPEIMSPTLYPFVGTPSARSNRSPGY